MSTKFKKAYGDWTEFRALTPAPIEIDYHAEEGNNDGLIYNERMDAVYTGALNILKEAYGQGHKWVIFIHGWSTSRRGKTTCRSQIRKAMRSSEATPYIDRSNCTQHQTIFVAAIQPKKLPEL